MKPQIGWAIMGTWEDLNGDVKPFLYVGWWLTRSDAITRHSQDKGKTWEECKKRGDRAIKVIIRPNPRKVKKGRK